ncbi:centromere protein S-like [Neocloeon triangulifer]|uniref:centromere protein S-like n=1 Tax=Neocloeon triangulifer TaxID=2078957 RepID=UPI00286F4AAB|nr:centromere protein S-like [Neocloeon triangulifer]XP_059472416.1 centromere protein S-like [Neocloeon triangulifer]
MENKISELTNEKKLKLALVLEVRKVIEEVSENMKFTFTKESMNLITELVWKKMQAAGSDVEAFSKHAKRTTVNPEDVKLLARRNPILKNYLAEMADELKSKKEPRKKSKKELASKLPKDDIEQEMEVVVPENQPGPSRNEQKNEPEKIDFDDDFGLTESSPIYISD